MKLVFVIKMEELLVTYGSNQCSSLMLIVLISILFRLLLYYFHLFLLCLYPVSKAYLSERQKNDDVTFDLYINLVVLSLKCIIICCLFVLLLSKNFIGVALLF